MLALPEEREKSRLLAQKLAELNEKRKELTAESINSALETVANSAALDKVLVLTDRHMHESVAGIVAGRVRDAVNRPCLMLTQAAGPEGEPAMKGSGRSVEGYDLFGALYAHRHLFTRFGGHYMAAGLTLPQGNVEALRLALNENCGLEDFTESINIDHVLEPDEITLPLSQELTRLAPFGKGNPEPLFASYGLQVDHVRRINEKNTLIFNFRTKTGRGVKGIAFGLNDKYNDGDTRIDAVYTVETNAFNGLDSVQMRIKEVKSAN
jgi:single-stranded-DNA-specific exonuclease